MAHWIKYMCERCKSLAQNDAGPPEKCWITGCTGKLLVGTSHLRLRILGVEGDLVRFQIMGTNKLIDEVVGHFLFDERSGCEHALPVWRFLRLAQTIQSYFENAAEWEKAEPVSLLPPRCDECGADLLRKGENMSEEVDLAGIAFTKRELAALMIASGTDIGTWEWTSGSDIDARRPRYGHTANLFVKMADAILERCKKP